MCLAVWCTFSPGQPSCTQRTNWTELNWTALSSTFNSVQFSSVTSKAHTGLNTERPVARSRGQRPKSRVLNIVIQLNWKYVISVYRKRYFSHLIKKSLLIYCNLSLEWLCGRIDCSVHQPGCERDWTRMNRWLQFSWVHMRRRTVECVLSDRTRLNWTRPPVQFSSVQFFRFVQGFTVSLTF